MKDSWRTPLIISILSLGLGVFLLTQIDISSGIPSYDSLSHAEGRLSCVRGPTRLFGVRFGLIGVDLGFSTPGVQRRYILCVPTSSAVTQEPSIRNMTRKSDSI